MDYGTSTDCVGKACHAVIADEEAICENGSSACTEAKLLEAEASGFHDATLIEATCKIKEILEGIPADPRGRSLSLIHTKFGSLLAWVDHKTVAPEDGVRPDADDATIAKALRLKRVAASGAGAI